jgi:hypothetical protein
MLKKFFAFSLLAAGLMITPTTAFAEQSQTNVQKPTNDAAVIDNTKSIIERTTQTNICVHGCF